MGRRSPFPCPLNRFGCRNGIRLGGMGGVSDHVHSTVRAQWYQAWGLAAFPVHVHSTGLVLNGIRQLAWGVSCPCPSNRSGCRNGIRGMGRPSLSQPPTGCRRHQHGARLLYAHWSCRNDIRHGEWGGVLLSGHSTGSGCRNDMARGMGRRSV
ncbi:hypothetical protein AVEN_141366-1 [Araneus ventricosus]|uniref:Uncharacterized protein n=1 Tax=Araneus ventricosus TaxID=182803 RepID=A0A4Y2CYH4_ARAVE|nr:hypothetical protein AVEN_141366-1 [Araneus ventricosus]